MSRLVSVYLQTHSTYLVSMPPEAFQEAEEQAVQFSGSGSDSDSDLDHPRLSMHISTVPVLVPVAS